MAIYYHKAGRNWVVKSVVTGYRFSVPIKKFYWIGIFQGLKIQGFSSLSEIPIGKLATNFIAVPVTEGRKFYKE
jgi:hypothetical protein